MKIIYALQSVILLATFSFTTASAQPKPKLSDNAALRYYAAFAEMRDSAVTSDEAKKLNGILDGQNPYDDSQYKDLVEKNRPALELMARGTALPECDWGLDYQLGENMPVDYARNALSLGRLNVLYAFHLQIARLDDDSIRALVAGLRFSRDVGKGGSLFAMLAAKNLLLTYFRAVEFTVHLAGISPAQRAQLQKGIAQLGAEPLDWRSAVKLEMEVLRQHFANDSQALAALARITPAYISALSDSTKLPALQQLLSGAQQQQVSELIPNPKRVLEEKQDLTAKLAEIRLKLQPQ